MFIIFNNLLTLVTLLLGITKNSEVCSRMLVDANTAMRTRKKAYHRFVIFSKMAEYLESEEIFNMYRASYAHSLNSFRLVPICYGVLQ